MFTAVEIMHLVNLEYTTTLSVSPVKRCSQIPSFFNPLLETEPVRTPLAFGLDVYPIGPQTISYNCKERRKKRRDSSRG